MKTVSIARLRDMKIEGEKIATLTAYDATFAALIDACGMDVILVGDSLGMVIQGHATTLEVRLSDMLYHSAAVRRGSQRALIVSDMPFMSYSTPYQALGNAARLVSEGGAQIIKMEGGAWLCDAIHLLTERGIPVCGHLGLTPQSIHKLGGYRVQGRAADDAARIETDALALEAAGACLLVLECVPRTLAARISRSLKIPVIGIGAGADCDGQVLVLHDLLGISAKQPKFARDFLASNGSVRAAITEYVRAVKASEFPAPEHGYD